MNPIKPKKPKPQESDAFAWRYGMVGLTDAVDLAGRSGDDSRSANTATGGVRLLTDVDVTLRSALAGVDAIRGMLEIGKTTLRSWLEAVNNPKARRCWMRSWDNLLSQIADIAKQSGVGEVNLLHASSGVLRIPYFNVSVHADGEDHHFFTIGIGIHWIMGGESDPHELQGLIAISAREGQGVCWLEALSPWAAQMESESVIQSAICEQYEVLIARIGQFEDTLGFLEAQLLTFRGCFEECTGLLHEWKR